MSRAGSAWSSRPRIWRCSPRWCRACRTARSRPTRCSWARSGGAARYGRGPAWRGGWRRPRARASAASSARRGRGSHPARRGASSSRWTGAVSSRAASRPDVGVVIVAAGAGVRAGPGEPKQFRPIHGVPMLLRALRPFTSHPEVVHVVVALPAGHVQQPPDWLAKLGGERLGLVPGGDTRAQSVRAGLRALTPDATVVLVHDAPRPFVSRETIDGVIARPRGGGGPGAGAGGKPAPFRTDAEVGGALAPVTAHLRRGGLLASPTETVYGLGSRARETDVRALARLKGRRPDKPFLLLVSGQTMAEAQGLAFNEVASALARAFWPGPLTLVLAGGGGRLPDLLRGPEGGIAVRWTSHRGMARLVEALGEPITSTSANLPGRPPAPGPEAILRDFAAAAEAGTLVVLDGGVLGNSPPSTVVDCTRPTPRLVREGALTLVDLRRAAGRLAP